MPGQCLAIVLCVKQQTSTFTGKETQKQTASFLKKGIEQVLGLLSVEVVDGVARGLAPPVFA